MLKSGVRLVLLLTSVCGALGSPTRVVNTAQGKVEGTLSSDGNYYEYTGLRYAIPLKFRAPAEPPSFPGIYKANARTVICAQFPSHDLLSAPSLNDDCLVLNVFSPATTGNTTRPVMVYIHGGGFGVGSSSPSFYGPQYLMAQDVVVITLNYRLNVYGFLNLGIKEAPGNAGLKDIRAALRWIKQNVGAFGGNPDNVTVFGQGAGASAAIYLTLSSSTKGLFHRIIAESGSVFSPNSFDALPLETASQVAHALDVKTKDPQELYKVFANTAVEEVLKAISKQLDPKSVFVPTIEQIFEGEEPFLVDAPYTILALGSKHPSFNPVPAIVGLTSVEGLITTLDAPTVIDRVNRLENGDLSAIDQRSLIVNKASEIKELRNLLKATYFGNDTSTKDVVLGGMVNLNTDFSFVGPNSLFVELYSNKSGLPVYDYVFDYIGKRNIGRLLTNTTLPATTHMDELFYLFEMERLPFPIDEEDARMMSFLTTLWCNFAKYGTPTPDSGAGAWLAHPHHLAIRLEPQYVTPLTPERSMFWRGIYFKYGSDIVPK